MLFVSSVRRPTAHTSGLLISHDLFRADSRGPSYTELSISSASGDGCNAQSAREVFLQGDRLASLRQLIETVGFILSWKIRVG